MGMPMNLVEVRHGESEGNLALRLSKQDDDSLMTPAHRARHSSTWRLTDRGILQIRQAGDWIKKNIGSKFFRYYASDYIRARESAAYLDLPGAHWYLEPMLRERDRGDLDVVSKSDIERKHKEFFDRLAVAPFYLRFPGGESMADVCIRVDRVHQTMHRECDGEDVIEVCHGEVMLATKVRLERMTPEALQKFRSDHAEDFWNGQVVHYTRRDPASGVVLPYFGWVRSVRTTDPNHLAEWRKIERPTFTNDDLLESVVKFPRIVN